MEYAGSSPVSATIENRFKATYHHIKLIDEGGSKEPENCMVLHSKCHIANFEALHHGRRYRFGLASRKILANTEIGSNM